MCFGHRMNNVSSWSGGIWSSQSVGMVLGPPVVRCRWFAPRLTVVTLPPRRGTESVTSRRPAFWSTRLGVRRFFVLQTSDRMTDVCWTAERWWLLLCRRYQEVLPAEGVSHSHGLKIPIEQMFSDYMQTRGLSNWKFWIVSLITETHRVLGIIA